MKGVVEEHGVVEYVSNRDLVAPPEAAHIEKCVLKNLRYGQRTNSSNMLPDNLLGVMPSIGFVGLEPVVDGDAGGGVGAPSETNAGDLVAISFYVHS